MEEPSIFFWLSDGCAWVRVIGPGSYRNSTAMKEFGRDSLNRGFETIVVDLKDCPEVDSTFMGTLAFLALRLRERKVGMVRVTNASPDVLKSFQDLGLDNLMQVSAPE